MERLQAWLAGARWRIYALAAGVLVVVVALAIAFEPAKEVSLGQVQELIDSSYNTGSAHCEPAGEGHDICRVATEKCSGRLLVKPVDEEIFTIITATPARLRSTEACANPETLTPQ